MGRLTAALVVATALVLSGGCSDGHDHGDEGHGEEGHGEAHGSGGSPVTVPGHYKEAVHKCEEISGKIGGLISSGKLSEVHAAAADIKKIAEKLPELAQKDLKPEMLKDVNIKAKELAGMFHEIDEAADAGNKDETVKLHEKMKGLIADLEKHAGGDHKKHD